MTKPVLATAVRRFLRTPRVARLATIGPDGYPHVVPLYFMRDGDDLVFGSDRDERKVWNARANPRGAVQIGGGDLTAEMGYMIQGDLSIEQDPGQKLMLRMLRRYEPEEEVQQHLAEWGGGDFVLIRLKPRRVIRVF